MTDVITKVAIGWVEYPFAGWGSEWAEVVYLTQAEYDALPASKLTDGKIYKIKTSGVAPTPGGGGTVWLDSNIVLNKINQVLSTVNTSCYVNQASVSNYVYVYWENSSLIWTYDISRDGWYIQKTYETYVIWLQSYNSSYSSNKHYIVHVVDVENNNKREGITLLSFLFIIA